MRKYLPQLTIVGYFGSWFAYFAWFWSHALTFDAAGNLQAGLVNIWGDWAAHFTMGSALGYRELWLSSSPFLINARFSYPFAANFISALLIRIGVPFFDAFVIPSFIGSCLLVVALFYFFRCLLNSRKIAIIASLIFLLNGGVGFVYFGRDILSSATPISTFLNPPHEYTRLDAENIKWISVIDSMVIPQRAFNLGFPLTLVALALIYSVFYREETTYRYLKLGGASLILGLMPLIHTHSFLAAGIILFFWLLGSFLKLKKWSFSTTSHLFFEWGMVGVISLSLAIPIYSYFFATQTQGFLRWYPGWLAKELSVNWFIFWFKNWGVTPLLGLAGLSVLLLRLRKDAYQKWWVSSFIWLPFFFLFGLSNLFIFQPFVWDNTKLLVWAAVGIAGLGAFFFKWLFEFSQTFNRLWRGLSLILIASLFFTTIASGTLDAYWDLRTDLHSYTLYTAEELELAAWAKKETPLDSIWLTGDQHNHWLFNLTGRQSLITYRGWLWTHGYDYLATENDVRILYEQPSQLDLFDRYGVEYVVIGKNETEVWGANKTAFLASWKIVKQSENFIVFNR